MLETRSRDPLIIGEGIDKGLGHGVDAAGTWGKI